MSVSEWEQAKPAHHERRMAIINEVYDIMSVSEWEQDTENLRLQMNKRG